MLATSPEVTWAVVAIHPHSVHTPIAHPPPKSHPLTALRRRLPHPCLELGEELRVQSVSGDRKLPVAAKGTGAFCAVPGLGEEVGGGGGPSAVFHPSAVLPALRKAGTVCYTGAGMYRVFQMAPVQSSAGCFLFIFFLQQCYPAVPALICPPPH